MLQWCLRHKYNKYFIGNIEGIITTTDQPNITSIGKLKQLEVEGNIIGVNKLITNEIEDNRQWKLLIDRKIACICHSVTLTAEGQEVKLGQVHDALIVDGKVQMFYVTERVLAEGE